MKKTWAIGLFLIALMTLSILPLAIAEENLGIDDTGSENSKEQYARVMPVAIKAEARLSDALKVKNEKYEDTKIRYDEAFDKLKKVKLEIRNETSAERINASKSFLNSAANRIIAQLERVKTVAQSNNASSTVTEMQGYIDQINSQIKPAIASATTIEELRLQSNALTALWNDVQTSLGKHYNEFVVNKTKNLIERIENVQNKVDAQMQQLEAKGYNTTIAQEKMKDLVEKIAEAKQRVLQAQAEFALVTLAPGRDEHFKKGQELIKEANEIINKVNRGLNDFFKNIRSNIKEVRVERKEVRNQTAQRLNEIKAEREEKMNETRAKIQDNKEEAARLREQAKERAEELKEQAAQKRELAKNMVPQKRNISTSVIEQKEIAVAAEVQ